MSSHSYDHEKGSSRSTRDVSRTFEERHRDRYDKEKYRSRSRSPRRSSPSRSSKHSPDRSKYRNSSYEAKRKHGRDGPDVELPAPPPPPRISKISIGFTKPKAPIKMSLSSTAKSTVAKKPSIASVFNDDDDDEPEEMPAEAKMRMRNIGRETPTSAGPNSFGKTKQGFCDAKKVFEKNLKEALETAEKPTSSKFPQTIYKIKAP